MRFTPFVRTAVGGDSALSDAMNLFIISEAERAKLLSVYIGLKTPVILSPNGINTGMFKPNDKSREEVLVTLSTAPCEGSKHSSTPLPTIGFEHQVVFVGKFADWKRLDCLLRAAAIYEKAIAESGEKVSDFEFVCCFEVGFFLYSCHLFSSFGCL
jgi:glycosyltransferase involved in cell wall biosynthesis